MRYLNDFEEVRYAYGAFFDFFDHEAVRNRLNDDYAELALLHAKDEFSSLLLSGFSSHLNYSLSFSEVDDCLSQWRAYGRYAIEIDPSKWDVQLVSCKYGIGNAWKEISPKVLDSLRLIGRDLRDYSGEIRLKGIVGYKNLIKSLAEYKHPGFHEEREWRLLWDDREVEDSGVRYRARGDLIIPYAEAYIPLSCITGIRVGPMGDQELAAQSLREFVRKVCSEFGSDQEIQITLSDTPFRSS